MKKSLIAIVITLIVGLTGCSSTVPKKDYDSQAKELEKAQEEIANLKTEKAEEAISESAAKGWVSTAFGEDAESIVSGSNLYVNIETGYTISEKSIEALWHKVYDALSLYSSYYKEAPDSLPYDSVTILIKEEETGLNMLAFQFLKGADGSFSQNCSMVNIEDMSTIIPYLNKALK